MNKFIHGVVFVSTLGLTACGAQMVSSPGGASVSHYAPVNEESRGGIVKYLNDGADFVLEQRREDAYKQMFTACGGKYRIDSEGQQADGGTVTVMDNNAFWGSSHYWYIKFSCIQ